MMSEKKDEKKERYDRLGKHVIAAHFEGSAFTAFKSLGFELSKSTDVLVHEAVALLFTKYGRPVPVELKNKLTRKGIISPR